MKVQNSITFIVSKNYGPPLSLSVPVWRFYSGLILFCVLATGLSVLGIVFLITQPRIKQIEEENRQLRLEREALREQIVTSSLELYETKIARFIASRQSGGGNKEKSNRNLAIFSGEVYQPPIRVDSYSTRVNRRNVEISFRLVNQGDDKNNRGGFLFAIFENEETTPTNYMSTPPVNINPDGFPQTYKSGIRFTRISRAVNFRRRVKRTNGDEIFTHVTLYLFSIRGGLLLKERYELDRDLFFKEKAVQKTQLNT